MFPLEYTKSTYGNNNFDNLTDFMDYSEVDEFLNELMQPSASPRLARPATLQRITKC